MKSASSKSSDSSCKSDKKKKKKKDRKKKDKKKDKKKRSKNPPIAQLNLRNSGSTSDGGGEGGEEYDDTRSIGTASTITISSYTHSTGGSKWQNFANDSNSSSGNDGQSVGSGNSRSVTSGNDNNSTHSDNNNSANNNSASNPTTKAIVTRMPYTDSYNEHGWYTGQVDSNTGTPNGLGTMNYANGAVYDGEWNDGVSSTPGKTREEPMMSTSGGFGGSGSMMQSRSIPRRFRHEQRATCTLGQGGRSYLATLNEDGSSSDYEYSPSSSRSSSRSASRSQSVSPPNLPQSELQAKVVCGMLWTDVHGATGAYTGEVNCLNIPDGMGSMRYDHGVVTEGM